MEKVVAAVDELEDGDVKGVEVGEVEVLLVKLDGEFYAVGGECSHFGAPLADGVIHNGRVRCPWHQACFDAVSGEMEEPPGLDALSKFEARQEGGKVIVTVPEGSTGETRPEMVEKDLNQDDRVFVIVGGGAAGISAAETLRTSGFQGEIKLVTREENPPYDRTQLSKVRMSKNLKSIPTLRSEELYEEADIDLMTGTEVTGIDKVEKQVSLKRGKNLSYDKLLIATGSEPNDLPVPGTDKENVFKLRTPGDLSEINQAAESGSHALVVGSSFIGMETAVSLHERGLDVTVVSLSSVPFEEVLGEEIGELYRKTHLEKGVNFELNSKVKSFEGNGRAEELELQDGTSLPADFFVLGVGVSPATGFLDGKFELNDDGGLSVDSGMKVEEDVYAAGDVASFPYWATGEEVRIEHWRLAQQHGRLAGKNMAGMDEEYESVPLFWTNQFDIYLRYIGYADSWDEVIFDGEVSEKNFVAYFVGENQVQAVAGVNVNQKMAALSELILEDELPDPETIRSNGFEPIKKLRELG